MYTFGVGVRKGKIGGLSIIPHRVPMSKIRFGGQASRHRVVGVCSFWGLAGFGLVGFEAFSIRCFLGGGVFVERCSQGR